MPPSAVNQWINLTGVLGFLAALLMMRLYPPAGMWAPVFIVSAAYALPILILERWILKTHRRESTGLQPETRPFASKRVATKWLGFLATLGVIAFFYWLFPEYRGTYYAEYMALLKRCFAWLLLFGLAYIAWADERAENPHDAYYWLGQTLLQRKRVAPVGILTQHALGWLVKAFFLPLMVIGIKGNLQSLITLNTVQAIASFASFFPKATTFLFTLDLLTAVVGYSLTLRLFDTHIRSTEPTFKGWFSALMCYPPFKNVFMSAYLAYASESWMRVLAGTPTLQIIWGSVALLLLTCYTMASVNFGCRFSNLTHRGIITNGLYRFTKHPAYVSKNLYWWMLHMPWLPLVSGAEALRYTILMIGISAIYYWRARTEEAHLSFDPTYVAYAQAMNEQSIFAPLAEIFPCLRYRVKNTHFH